jgi:hypothetical protein
MGLKKVKTLPVQLYENRHLLIRRWQVERANYKKNSPIHLLARSCFQLSQLQEINVSDRDAWGA